LRIAYQNAGTAGPHVLLVHGFGASHESWNDIAPLLDDSYRLVALDLVGFGLSAKPARGDYSPLAQARIVNDFIDELGLNDVTLVGHSYGGGVALIATLLRQAPGIKRLVLIDAAGYEQPLPFFVAALRIPAVNFLVLNVLSPRVRAELTLRHLFYDIGLVTSERTDRYARYFDLPGAHHAFVSAARSMVPHNHEEIVRAIPTITLPTFVLWGANDAAIDVRNAHRFRADIPNSELLVLPKCGHIPHEEQPAQTADALRRFIDGS
jgi:pimeloyl-ACP methyl ester carboxylesterase